MVNPNTQILINAANDLLKVNSFQLWIRCLGFSQRLFLTLGVKVGGVCCDDVLRLERAGIN